MPGRFSSLTELSPVKQLFFPEYPTQGHGSCSHKVRQRRQGRRAREEAVLLMRASQQGNVKL